MFKRLFGQFYPDVPDDSYAAAEQRLQALEANITVAVIEGVPANCSIADSPFLAAYKANGGIRESNLHKWITDKRKRWYLMQVLRARRLCGWPQPD
jgi:hypothetical protein